MRTLLVVLLLPLFAVAAPVPKAPKLEDVFGKIADPKSDCKFEMSDAAVLTVTVPTTHPAREPNSQSTIPPQLGKVVKGDFVLTVRVAHKLPKGADKQGKVSGPAVMAGVSVVSADDPKNGVTAGILRRSKGDEWPVSLFASFRSNRTSGVSEQPWRVGTADALYLRVTRKGDTIDADMSRDGTKWTTVKSTTLTDLPDELTVGPVAFGCIDQEFSATFDQYEIKQLPKDEKK